jgi:hypothetical protein
MFGAACRMRMRPIPQILRKVSDHVGTDYDPRATSHDFRARPRHLWQGSGDANIHAPE